MRRIRHPYLHLLGVVLLLGALAGCEPAPPAFTQMTVATGEVGVPTTAVDPQQGTVYWAWFGKEDSLTNVYLARLESGHETISEPVQVNRLPGNANWHAQAPAQVAVGPEGQVYVAWTNKIDVEGRRFPASNLLVARSTDGGRTFESPTTVNDDAAGRPTSHTFHSIAAGPDGTIYVSWLDSRKRDHARAALAHHGQPTLQQASHSHSTAQHDAMPGTELRVARSTDGGQHFGTNVVVAQNTCQCCRTALDVTADGTVYLAWRHVFPDKSRDMALVRSTDYGMTFSEPVRVHEDGWTIEGCPHSGPALEVDGKGSIHVAWYTGVETGAGLFYAVSDDAGATFGAPHTLLADVPVSQVSLTEDRGGGVWLSWEDKKEHVVRLARAEGHDLRFDASSPGFSGDLPALAAAGGVWTLAWKGEHGIETRVARE
ncbi:MAG: sialidase family protein [Rhodothermales bacterium]